MGSKRTPTLYLLKFEDGEYAGLEISLKSINIKQSRTMRSVSSETEGEAFDRMLELIASRLHSWNREDEDGNPLPTTLESLEEEEPKLIHIIVNKWTQAIEGVPVPLESDSSAGETSAVASIPMEPLSTSLAS